MLSLSYLSDQVDTQVLFFKGLANKTRLAILKLLTMGSKTVTEICEELGFEQSRVSHNLSCLEFCGFVTSERDGKSKIYSFNRETIEPLLDLVDKHITNHGSNLLQCKVLKR